MIELSTALRGTDGLKTSTSNLTAGSGVDNRRYTKFDRTASEVASADDFSFSDLLDAVNPLQHIPLISSIYRGIAGEDIHPAARVAGDILYGGVIGVASAALGGLGGVADSVMIDKTGVGAGGTMLASLFGSDEDAPSTELAENATPSAPSADTAALAASAPLQPAAPPLPAVAQSAPQPAQADAAIAANTLPKEVTPDQLESVLSTLAQQTQTASTTKETASTSTSATTAASAAPTTALSPEKSFSLTQTKSYPVPPRGGQAYGGVMDTASLRHSPRTAAAIHLPSQNLLQTAATSPQATTNPVTASAKSTMAAQQPAPLPQNLIDDLRALAAARSYQSTARNTASGPTIIDIAQ